MNKIAVAMGMMWLAVGCAWLTDTENFGKKRSETEPIVEKVDTSLADTSIYITALEFPVTYDWRKDTLRGNVDCNLILIRDGKRKLALPVRYDRRISQDMDMHRVVGGHLYTDFSIGNETIISRDGVSLFRYPGEEIILGFKVSGIDIYTLGRSRSGKGFSYRKNGKALIEKQAGMVIGDYFNCAYPQGALYEDMGHLYFSYQANDVSGQTHYYLVEDRLETPLEVPSGCDICDVRVSDGRVCKLISFHDQPARLDAIIGDTSYSIKNIGGSILNAYFFFKSDDVMVLETVKLSDYGFVMMSLWNNKGRQALYMNHSSIYANGNRICYVGLSEGRVFEYRLPNKTVSVKDTCYLMSTRCATYKQGHFYVALTPADASLKPKLFIDEKSRSIDIANGFITSVSVVPEN